MKLIDSCEHHQYFHLTRPTTKPGILPVVDVHLPLWTGYPPLERFMRKRGYEWEGILRATIPERNGFGRLE